MSGDGEKVMLEVLELLRALPITSQVLRETGIGRAVVKLCRNCVGPTKDSVNKLIDTWRAQRGKPRHQRSDVASQRLASSASVACSPEPMADSVAVGGNVAALASATLTEST